MTTSEQRKEIEEIAEMESNTVSGLLRDVLFRYAWHVKKRRLAKMKEEYASAMATGGGIGEGGNP